MMIEFTSEAERRREQYLQQVRTCVGASITADPEEVLRGVREHIEAELQEAEQPVSEADLEAVLSRLGRPEQWVAEEDLPWWRRTAMRMQTGPEDWRLAYLSLGLLVLGAALVNPFVILGSFFVARAALAVAGDARALGERKWLIYPSLIIVYIPLAFLILLLPAWFTARSLAISHLSDLCVDPLSVAVTALWWLVLLLALGLSPEWFVVLFRPFLGSRPIRFVKLTALVIALIGIAAVVAMAAVVSLGR
jgi:hypothetical protein